MQPEEVRIYNPHLVYIREAHPSNTLRPELDLT